jgi:hypothetical protein
MAGEVGQLQPILTGDPGDRRLGYGFTLQDDLRRFCMAIAYATKAEADAAAQKFREALNNATWTRRQKS